MIGKTFHNVSFREWLVPVAWTTSVLQQRMSPVVALRGPGAMSDLSPQSPPKRTSTNHRSSDTTKDYLDGGSIFDPSRPSIRPRILTRNDFAPSTNSMRTVRDEVGTTRVLDGPGKRILVVARPGVE
jgi:hypothetical protein